MKHVSLEYFEKTFFPSPGPIGLDTNFKIFLLQFYLEIYIILPDNGASIRPV